MEERMISAEMKFGGEKREYPRVPMTASIRYRVLSPEEAERAMGKYFEPDKILNEYTESETLNVSREGVLMYTNEEIPVKSLLVVSLYFVIPGISCNCKALAEAVRRESEEDNDRYRYRIALKFLKITHHNLKNYKFMELQELLDVREESAT
ncbi:MAG TPA: hypothetical protein ENN43_05440 [bacterium]|nr:hypothetical protein [bacterium]